MPKQQYDENLSNLFNQHSTDKLKNRQSLFSLLEPKLQGLKAVDLGCGAGVDLEELAARGAETYGIDQAEAMVQLATKRVPSAKVVKGDYQQLPFEDNYFDVVYSKYAIWHCQNVDCVYKEVFRVLKANGCFLFLTTHPMREFFGKETKNYFQQENFSTTIFNGEITLHGFSHRLEDYLSPYFLSHFRLEEIVEGYEDADCSRYSDWAYPGYLIVKATKQSSL